jgi:DNA-binding GntR family transcriptional regulator
MGRRANKVAGNSAKATNTEDTSRVSNMPVQIAEEVRSMITRGTLPPGIRLGQAEVADRFKTSRAPVREAMKVLVAEGLVTHDQNRGFTVARLSSSEARQLYRIRQLVEAEVLATVQWPTEEQLEVYRRKVAMIEQLLQERKRAEWAIQHRQLREAVFALSPEKYIVQEALRLWSVADRYRSLLSATPHPSIRPDGSSTDRHLIEALADHDRLRLLSVFERDRGRIAEMLVEILESRGL